MRLHHESTLHLVMRRDMFEPLHNSSVTQRKQSQGTHKARRADSDDEARAEWRP